jgi:hypothetical protein
VGDKAAGQTTFGDEPHARMVFRLHTFMFADLVDFTGFTAEHGDERPRHGAGDRTQQRLVRLDRQHRFAGGFGGAAR